MFLVRTPDRVLVPRVRGAAKGAKAIKRGRTHRYPDPLPQGSGTHPKMTSLISQLSTFAVLQLQSPSPNATGFANGTTTGGSDSDSLFATAYSLWSFLLTSPAFRDGAKLFLLGGSIESARRLLSLAWSRIVESFFLTAEFEERDETFSEYLFRPSRMTLTTCMRCSMDNVLAVQTAFMEYV